MKKRMKVKIRQNKEIMFIEIIFILLFLLLIGNLVYFNAFKSEQIIINSYNPRQDLLEKRVIRGKILSQDKKVLAETVELKDGGYERVYPYSNKFAHVVGFASHGKSGIESYTNYHLLSSKGNVIQKVFNEIIDDKNTGNNVVTTLNSELQSAAYKALGKNKGAIVVIEASTGKILALVSKPDFNPNELDLVWDEIVKQDNDGESILFNRATQGTYPPGSTFKIITALQFIKSNPNWKDYRYNCTGKGVFYDNSISCYGNKAHGEVDLIKSFAVSCNTSFANIGTLIDVNDMKRLSNDLLFNTKLPFPLPYAQSSYTLDASSDKKFIPETVIGQGKTEMSPLHSALITASIANGGLLMKPYLIDSIENYEGKVVKKFMPEISQRLMSQEETDVLTELMTSVITSGTGKKLKGLSYSVAGKTGSAEHKEGEKAHAWFVGFAPVEKPEIVVSIVIENVGISSDYAVPAAKKILDAYFK